MNRILCFDTSNNSCSVAISHGQEILSYEQELQPSTQAEKLMILIESALKKASMKYEDIDYLAVTTGSGSFTGIRIGIAAAKGIIYASNIKPLGITNFEIAFYRLKMQVNEFDSAFIILNAYRDQLYIQEFTKKSTAYQAILINTTEIKDLLIKKSGQLVCAGSGLSVVFDQIKNLNNLTILPRFPTIRAIHLARYADEKINQGILNPIEPLYIRPPDAIIPK